MQNVFLKTWIGGFDVLTSEGVIGIFPHVDWIVFLFVILFSYRMFVLNKEVVRLKDGSSNKPQKKMANFKEYFRFLATGGLGYYPRFLKISFIILVISGVLAFIIIPVIFGVVDFIVYRN